MPDLNALPEDPGADTGLEQASTDASTSKTAHGHKPDSRAAVANVLALLGKTAKPGTAAKQRPVLPSARTRVAIERLVEFGTVERLTEAQLDMKALAQDLFDWGVPANASRATKATAKAVAKVLLARDDKGRSLYPQAVEMLSFAAAAAPLLQPDRLMRLIEVAPTVSTAFAPERYTMQLASALRTVLTRYPEQRREQLLVSMWRQAHEGRWWDMTSGVVSVRTGPGRRDTTAAELRAVAEHAVRDVLAGAREGTAEARAAVTEALVAGSLPFNDGTRRLVSELPESAELRAAMADLAARMRAADNIDPDMALHASHLTWLLPGERPETPLTWLARTLVAAITPDPETGEVSIEALPEKPKQFSGLYPLAELRGFPLPATIYKLHQTLLPVTTDGNVVVEVVHNAAELAANRDYMGNCTWSKKDRMDRGSYALLRLWRGDDCFNASLTHRVTSWQVEEVNSRFNHGSVPPDIRTGVEALAQLLPAPGPLAEVTKRHRRDVSYAVA